MVKPLKTSMHISYDIRMSPNKGETAVYGHGLIISLRDSGSNQVSFGFTLLLIVLLRRHEWVSNGRHHSLNIGYTDLKVPLFFIIINYFNYVTAEIL